jgi:hypothetical protein
MNGCEHGPQHEETVVDEDERTACCAALVTFTGDGDLVCKCCYALVTGGADVSGYVGDVTIIENEGTEEVQP